MANCCEEIKKPDECCETTNGEHGWDCRYRQILWVILLINISMFVVEIASGTYSGSQALLADALDFFGDAANYGISLYVLNRSINWRAKASIIKGSTMGLFGLWILGSTIYKALTTGVPQAEVITLPRSGRLDGYEQPKGLPLDQDQIKNLQTHLNLGRLAAADS